MLKYSYPGVYVVEVEGSAWPIEGVDTSTSGYFDETLLGLLKAVAERFAPGWTEPNNRDPGLR